jgi:hypothetical protein
MTTKIKLPASVRTVKWIARIMSIIVIGALLIYIGDALKSIILAEFKSTGTFSAVELSVIGAGIIGLGLAWKWEAVGGLIAMVAFIALAFTKLNDEMSPLTLFPLNLNAMLFLLAWILKLRYVKLKKSADGEQPQAKIDQ